LKRVTSLIDKRFLLGLALGVLITTSLVFATCYFTATSPHSYSFIIREDTKRHNLVIVRLYRNGILIYEGITHNIIVTCGSNYITNILGFNNITNMNSTIYVSLSADPTPQTSWTKLPNEITTNGLDRTTGTATKLNQTAYQVQASWTASGSATVNCTGLHWSPIDGSDGTMLAAASLPDTLNLLANDNLQVTWIVNTPPG